MQGSDLCAFCDLSPLIPTTTSCGRFLHNPHFMHEEAEAQRGKAVCPRSYSGHPGPGLRSAHGTPDPCSEHSECVYVGGWFSGEFTEEEIEFLEARGHHVEKVDVLSWVHGSRRTNNFIIGVKDPRSPDAAGATIL